MSRNRTRLTRLALAMVRSAGIYAPDIPDAVAEAVDRAWRQPPRRRRQAAAEAVRRRLARQLAVRQRELPTEAVALRAIGEYEAVRRLYEFRFDGPGASWRAGFDHQSRRFAEENGVCPRCARPGDFSGPEARCECGFAME